MILTLSGILTSAATSTTRVGLVEGRLRPCPTSPNCVCSQGEEDGRHAIEPLKYDGELADAKQKLRAVLADFPRTVFAEEREAYWRVEFKTLLMRFIDDVEFLFDPKVKAIHLRSASRVGHSDFGANRKRVEDLRRRFNEAK